MSTKKEPCKVLDTKNDMVDHPGWVMPARSTRSSSSSMQNPPTMQVSSTSWRGPTQVDEKECEAILASFTEKVSKTEAILQFPQACRE